MLALSLFFIFCFIACLGVPLMYALIATTLGMILFAGMSYPIETILLTFISGVEPFILIAVPLFIFAGELLSKGGVGKRIVDFTQTLFGFLPGGLGVVTCISCLLFGGVSGSAIADTAAIGSMVIPMMKRKGYEPAFAAALLAVAGTLALLMPLSIPFLVYAFIAGVSMRQLSMSGIGPAIITAMALMAVCMWYGRKTGCDSGGRVSTAKEIWTAFRSAASALIMPVIIVGGIWSGIFTPTEAAAVAVVYGLVISIYVYKDIAWKDVTPLLLKAFQTSATVMLVIGATGCLSWLLTVEQVAVQLTEWVRMFAHEPWVFLLLVNGVLFLLGIFIEPLPAMLLSAPLLLPMAKNFGVDMVHFGVVVTANLAIALYTPPVGGTLFVAAKLAGAGIGPITKHLMPLMGATLLMLIIITYVPQLTQFIQWMLIR
jgi:C4-dicarboxylate transporter, DctM subunit